MVSTKLMALLELVVVVEDHLLCSQSGSFKGIRLHKDMKVVKVLNDKMHLLIKEQIYLLQRRVTVHQKALSGVHGQTQYEALQRATTKKCFSY